MLRHPLRIRTDIRLTDRLAVRVPTVPAHRRRRCEDLLLLRPNRIDRKPNTASNNARGNGDSSYSPHDSRILIHHHGERGEASWIALRCPDRKRPVVDETRPSREPSSPP